MKSKFHFILLAVLVFDSCNQNINYNEKLDDTIPVDIVKEKTIIRDNNYGFNLIGEWSMAYTKSINSTIKCNQCPYVVFEKNNIAKITLLSGEVEVYNYSIKNDTLWFSYSKGNKKSNRNIYFNDRYLMISKIEKDYYELELKQTEKNFSYILRKKE